MDEASGGGIMEEAWRHLEEASWRRHQGGDVREEASWRRPHGGGIMEESPMPQALVRHYEITWLR